LSREELIESISDWDMGNLFMMMEMMFMRVLASLGRNPLYFCFEGNSKRIIQVLKGAMTRTS